MTAIEKMHNDFMGNFVDDPDYAINFFKENNLLLNNIAFESDEDLKLFEKFFWYYITA